jgi:hypothetical protein
VSNWAKQIAEYEKRQKFWARFRWAMVLGIIVAVLVLLLCTSGCGEPKVYTDPIKHEKYTIRKDDGTFRTEADDWISMGTAIVGGILGLTGTGAAVRYGLKAATAVRALGSVSGHMETALNMLPATDRDAITGKMQIEQEALGVVNLVQRVRHKPVTPKLMDGTPPVSATVTASAPGNTISNAE